MSEASVAGVRITHPDRVLYPGQGVTKRQLVEYYLDVAAWILPHLEGRPLSVVRCPRGRGDECFYQKHLTEGLPEEVGGIEVREAGRGDKELYIAVDSVAGLVALLQFGVLEFHPWGARQDDLERPDRLVFDLDPGPDAEWALVVKAARRLRRRLGDLGLESFLRTTGGKGLHLVVPLVRRRTWDHARTFARRLAQEIAASDPDRYVAEALKEKRQGRVFIDYLRNSRGATSIASYSTRASDGAPVATNLRWDELGSLDSSDAYDITSVRRRLARLGSDPWNGFFDVRQSITGAMLEELGVE